MKPQDDEKIYSAEELDIAIGRDIYGFNPKGLAYLFMSKQIVQPNGPVIHYAPELKWRELKHSEIFEGRQPLLAFDSTVVEKIRQSVNHASQILRIESDDLLRKENEYLKEQNKRLLDVVAGIAERMTSKGR